MRYQWRHLDHLASPGDGTVSAALESWHAYSGYRIRTHIPRIHIFRIHLRRIHLFRIHILMMLIFSTHIQNANIQNTYLSHSYSGHICRAYTCIQGIDTYSRDRYSRHIQGTRTFRAQDTDIKGSWYSEKKEKESLFCLTTPLEHIDFHIINYWTSSLWSWWHISLEETHCRHISYSFQ